MKKNTLFLFFLLCSLRLVAGEHRIIRENFLRTVLYDNQDERKLMEILERIPPEKEVSDQVVVELHQRYATPASEVERLLAALQPDGSWNDVDYSDRKRSGWAPKVHADRILTLAKLYGMPRSDFYRSPRLCDALHRTMNFWFEKKLECPNWWYNQIGIPKTLGPAFLLFEEQLSAREKQEAVRVMEHSRFGMTGQNKVWLAGNVFIRALLQNDFALLQAARDTIASEIVTGREEGIQDDWSFHQHGPQQQFGNYGMAYISTMATWSTVFSGTTLAFGREQLDILYALLTQGYRRITWKGNLDVNVLGRQFFHNVQHHKALTLAFTALALSQADPAHRTEYTDMIAENFFPDRNFTPLTGLYHFRKSDLTNYRTPHWMGSVKMASTRIIGGESGNGDNMQGYNLADGAAYTYVDGTEYTNIYPCWDWRKIPGITSYDTPAPLPVLQWGSYKNNSAFAGNVSGGTEGLTAMVLDREGVKAHKAWIFTPGYMLCLGSAVSSDSSCPLATSIDQRLKRNELLALEEDTWTPVTGTREFAVTGQPVRFFHENTGYIVLQPAQCTAFSGPRTGNWHEVMEMYPSQPVTQEVVSLYLGHGNCPRNGQYGYLVLPAVTTSEVKDFPLSSVRILRNEPAVQAVSTGNGQTFFVAVYSAGAAVELSDVLRLSALTPGLYLLKQEAGKWKLAVSDPTQQLSAVSFQVNDRVYTLDLPGGTQKGGTTAVTL